MVAQKLNRLDVSRSRVSFPFSLLDREREQHAAVIQKAT